MAINSNEWLDREGKVAVTTPRRWLRFSLRTLLMVMLLVAAFCGGWMSHKRWGRLELEKALAEIEKLRRAPRVEYIDGLDIFISNGSQEVIESFREFEDWLESQPNK
jgi:hypothetical protein